MLRPSPDRQRCPVCKASRGLAVDTGRSGKPIFFCHAKGCDVAAWVRSSGGSLPARKPRGNYVPPEEEEYLRLRRAVAILRAAAEAEAGAPADYLRGRGIVGTPPGAMLMPARVSQRIIGRSYPAMVTPVTDREGRLRGAQVTLLTRDGTRRIKGKKFTYGKVGGGFVQLGEIDPDRPLVIGEGIESTLSAMQIADLPGIATLGTSGLAAVVPPPAREYIIAADADPAGRRAAAALAERLQYGGSRVRVATPPREGDDWNDVLAAGRDDDWQAAVDAGRGQEPAGPISALEEGRFMELTFPERELLLEPWLPRPGLAMVFAPKGQGKTWFALAVGKAIAEGRDLLGWRCPAYGRVMYIEGELPGQSVQDRLRKFRQSPPGMFFVLCRDTFLLRRKVMPDLGDADGRAEVDRIIKQCRPDVIIIDTISTLVRSGVENDAESWAPIQAWLLGHRWQGRTIILMHHSGKSGQQRGTSKREDVMDTIIRLQKQDDACTDAESVFDLTFEKSRDFFGKDAEPMRLRFSVEGGRARWRAEAMRDVQQETVRAMLAAGMRQKEVARELKLSVGRVSQIVKKLRLADADGAAGAAGDNVVNFPRKPPARE